MVVVGHETGTADKTVIDIANLVLKFSSDIGELANKGLHDYYDYVKSMPYRRDPSGVEVVPRPKYIIKYGFGIGRDCKKQSIMMSSWAHENGIPYKLSVVSGRPDKKPHHIFVCVKIDGHWIDVDATYPNYKIGNNKSYTYRKNYEVFE